MTRSYQPAYNPRIKPPQALSMTHIFRKRSRRRYRMEERETDRLKRSETISNSVAAASMLDGALGAGADELLRPKIDILWRERESERVD
jgi:hypothetical protein